MTTIDAVSTNALLDAHLRARGTLVVAHRGTGLASIVENTRAGALAALASGADVVEIDLTESADGAWYAFHDGTERRLLGIEQNLQELTAAQIDALRHVDADRPGRPSRVEPLLEVLASLRADRPDAPLVNLDRSWGSWERLLPALDELDMTRQLLLKSPAAQTGPIDVLRAHAEPYPYLPICRTPEQVEQLVDDPALNLVGVELLAAEASHPFVDAGYIGALQERGLRVLVNAEVLSNGIPLFAGHDDERAILEGPEQGWGPLLELGVDLIQTDWPWLLSRHRDAASR